MSLGKNISGSSHRYLTNSETEKVFWGLLGLPTFCHEISRNRKKIVFLMSYAKKVLNICKIDLFCNYLFFDNFNYVTWFWVRWGAKDFDASVALKIILGPHSKLANRWGARGSGVAQTFHCYYQPKKTTKPSTNGVWPLKIGRLRYFKWGATSR